ncbi:MAG: T9SS type A sorting domain-containing protein, partial [Bacteroidales bacterium]|nr:T9SS type A sorting domain-containing protein [Candidatus Colicola caccequi]
DCKNPITFDWENCNINPKNEPTWYVVNLIDADSTLVIPDGKDLQISVTNLTDLSATAEAAFYFDCNNLAFASHTYTFGPRQTEGRVIDRDLFEMLGKPAALFIMVSGSQPMKICADFVDLSQDTIIVSKRDTLVCKGEIYTFFENTFEVEKDTVLKKLVPFQMGLRVADSLYIDSIVVYREVQEQTIPETEIPQAIVGKAFDMDSLATNVRAIYDAATTGKDSAKVDTIFWLAMDQEYPTKYHYVDEEGAAYLKNLPQMPTLYLQYIVNGCDHQMVIAYLQVSVIGQSKSDTLTYCKQSQIDTTWHNQHITEPGTYVYEEGGFIDSLTILLNDVPDTLSMEIVSKFGNRMLVFNLNKFKGDNGFEPAETQVEWYSTADPTTPIHTGYYYTLPDGGVITGSYYAVTKVVNPDACDQVFISNTLVNNSGVSMRLAPNCVSEGGLMTIYNVDPTQATSVRIIDATGREVGNKKSINMENVNVEATWPVGAYLMRVENASQGDTFRFLIVR